MKRQIEHNTQSAFVQWLWLNYRDVRWFAVPNGGARNAITGAILKKEGVRKGALDFVFPVARKGHHGLFLEFKAPDGKLSPEQKWFEQGLSDEGYLVKIPRSIDQAIEAVKEYMG